MSQKDSRRSTLFAVLVLALTAGFAGRRAVLRGGAAAAPIVDADETMRDAVAALPPAMSPGVIAPSRLAVWASPALRRKQAERELLARRMARNPEPAR
jgi:hypothetical protein